ncbi:MAG: acyl-CoA dehydrogenase family protein, partial [Mycobacterium sp.]
CGELVRAHVLWFDETYDGHRDYGYERVIEAAQKGSPISLAEASAIKWYCSQAATDVAMEAVQVFGGNGYMTEYRVEQLARDAKSLMIYAGSNEVQITHVARGLLSD